MGKIFLLVLVQFQFLVLLKTIAMIIRVIEHTRTRARRLVNACTLIPFAFPGGDFDSSLTDDWESEKPNAESVTTSSSHRTAQTPKENLHHPSPPSQLTASEHFQENVWDRSSEFFVFVLIFAIPH